MTRDEIQSIEWAGPLKFGRSEQQASGAYARMPLQTCPACSRERGVGHAEWCFIDAALRSRPAPPDDLVANQAYGYLSRLLTTCAPQCQPLPDLLGVCSQIDNLIAGLRAPAPVAAPAPETPAPVDVPACPDGQHSYRRNAPPQNGDVCFVCRKSIWWETPAPDAMPAPNWIECPNCGGMGTTFHDILVGGTEHDTEERCCEVCKGTGKRRQEAQPSKLAPGEMPPSSTWGDLGRAAKCSRCNDDGRPCSHCEAQP